MAGRKENLTNMGKGRPKGTKNKFGQEAKEAFALAFEGAGGVRAFTDWAKDNRETFYKLYSKLIPVELAGSVNVTKSASDLSDDELAAIAAQKTASRGEPQHTLN